MHNWHFSQTHTCGLMGRALCWSGTSPYLGTSPGQIGRAYTRVDDTNIALLKALTPVLLDILEASLIFRQPTIRNWDKSSTLATAVGFLPSSKKLSRGVKHSCKQAFPPIQEPRILSRLDQAVYSGYLSVRIVRTTCGGLESRLVGPSPFTL